MYKQNNYVEIELLCALCGTIITGRVKPVKNARCFKCRKKYLKEQSKKQRGEKEAKEDKVKDNIELPKKLKEIHQKMWLSRMFT